MRKGGVRKRRKSFGLGGGGREKRGVGGRYYLDGRWEIEKSFSEEVGGIRGGR